MSKESPQISVIVPVFNKAKYLEKALETIVNQTFQDFECILVDDGSDDGSELICDNYSSKDDRFKVIHTKNCGVSHARNVALDSVRGQFIVFVDGDDEVASEYLANLIDTKTKNDVDMVVSWIGDLDENKQLKHRSFPIKPGRYDLDEIIQSFVDLQLNSGIFGWCVSKIIPSEMVRDIRFDENMALAEDLDFYLKVYEKTSTLYLDDSAYYYYRENTENSSIKNDDDIDYISQLKLLLRIRDFLIQKNAWCGENKRRTESRISDYVYFSLFHCSLKCFDQLFENAYSLWMCTDNQTIEASGFKKAVLLSTLKHDMKKTKFLIQAYRYLKKVVKRND